MNKAVGYGGQIINIPKNHRTIGKVKIFVKK